MLKFTLSNTNALSKYLQGKSVDVINALRNADITISTLQSCWEKLHFNNVWKKVQMISNKIKTWIEEGAPQIEFKDAHLPCGKPSAGLQALVGEIATPQLMLQSHYRINFYCKGLDQSIAELKYCFQSKDNDILCALGDIASEIYQILNISLKLQIFMIWTMILSSVINDFLRDS